MSVTSNTALRITELDFSSIKNNLKNYLKNQSQFQDFDFEGSGMSVLLDILAYNTHYMGYYLNVVGNEMFLDTAQRRDSIISHAKNLNYVPGSAQGALVKATIVVTPGAAEDQTKSVLTLNKFTKFIAQDIDGINYPFVSLYSNTVSKSGSTFTFNNIVLKQGEVITRQYLMESTNTKRRFDIPSSNVDTTTIAVTVQASSTNTSTEVYTLADDITTIGSNSAVYFIEENPNSKYTIYFGDNVLGKTPPVGSIVIVNYLDTVGSVSNNVSRFYISDPIGSVYRNNVSVTAANSSYGGMDRETLEQVRFRAPYFYTTQNRAVTIQDYKTLITKDYTNIDSVSVWGGEDNDPIVYGKVFLSFKTKNNYFLTNQEKETIKNDLISKRSVMTVFPEIVDPDYAYVLLKGTVTYNPAITNLTSNQLLTLVRAAIADYNTRELNNFTSTFRKSKLQQYIENADRSITGSSIVPYIQKRIPITLNSKTKYLIDYNTSLLRFDYSNRLFTTPEIQTVDDNGVLRNIYFEEAPISDTGIQSITIINSGKNYTSAPTITITGDGVEATATAKVSGGRISSITVTNAGKNYSMAAVTITGGGGSEGQAVPILYSKIGYLRSYYLKSTGEKQILNSQAGFINYETGKVEIYNLYSQTGTPVNRYYDTDVFTMNIPLEKETILPLRNKIVTIDDNDPIAIQLEMVAES